MEKNTKNECVPKSDNQSKSEEKKGELSPVPVCRSVQSGQTATHPCKYLTGKK